MCRQLGVSEIRMQPIMPLGRAIDNYNEIVPSYFEYQKLSRKLQELKYQSIDNGTVVEWGDPIDHLRKFSTSSFISNPSLGISAYGEITVSPYLPISVGCIKRHSLEEYWESGLKNVWSIGVIKEIASLITSISSMDLSKERLPKTYYEKNLMFKIKIKTDLPWWISFRELSNELHLKQEAMLPLAYGEQADLLIYSFFGECLL